MAGIEDAIRDLMAAQRVALRDELVSMIRAVVREELLSVGSPVPGSDRPYLSTTDAAQLLGVEADTIRSWINDGTLRARVLPGGRAWRIRREDLDACLRNVQADGGTPIDIRRAAEQMKKRYAEAGRRGEEVGRGEHLSERK